MTRLSIYLHSFLPCLPALSFFFFYIYSLAALLSFFSSASAYGEEHRVGFSLTSFPAAFWYLIFLSHFVEYCLVLSCPLVNKGASSIIAISSCLSFFFFFFSSLFSLLILLQRFPKRLFGFLSCLVYIYLSYLYIYFLWMSFILFYFSLFLLYFFIYMFPLSVLASQHSSTTYRQHGMASCIYICTYGTHFFFFLSFFLPEWNGGISWMAGHFNTAGGDDDGHIYIYIHTFNPFF